MVVNRVLPATENHRLWWRQKTGAWLLALVRDLHHQRYGASGAGMEGRRISPIWHQTSRPALALRQLRGQVLNLTLPRMQEGQYHHIFPQWAATRSGRTVQQVSHAHKRVQLYPNIIGLSFSKWKCPNSQDHPNQRPTRSGSVLRTEGKPSNQIHMYQEDWMYSRHACH